MDTAGKAVLFSGVTVLISLSAVMLVPSPAFRSMASASCSRSLFVLAAALTLLPAVLGKLGDRRSTGWRCRGCTAASTARRASPRWAERLWRRPWLFGMPRVAAARRARAPRPRPRHRHALDQGRAQERRLARRLRPGAGRPSAPALPARSRSCRPRADADATSLTVAEADPGIAGVCRRYAVAQRLGAPAQRHADRRPIRPRRWATTIDRLRATLPAGRARRRRRGREPRSRARARRQDAARDRRRARARLPAPAGRAAGAADRRRRRGHEPARHRRRLRGRPTDLPGRPRQPACSASSPGLPQRLGPRVLLRHDLRDLDGLHRLPARLGQGALGSKPRRPRGHDRRRRPLRPRHLRRRRRHGRGLLHLRALRAAAARRRWASSSASPCCSTRC